MRALVLPFAALLLLPACELLDDPAASEPGEVDGTEVPTTFIPEYPSGSGAVSVDPGLPALEPEWNDSALDERFFAAPWPSDERVTDRGTLDLTAFPRSNRGLVRDYRELFEAEVRGYSTMPVLYVSIPDIGEHLDPPEPFDTLRRRAVIQLVDISPERCGALTPLEATARTRGDRYLPANVLMAAPVHGFPLRPSTRYAFVVREGLVAEAGYRLARPSAMASRLEAADPGGDGPWDALVRCLERADMDVDSVAVATVFTTGEPAELLRLVRAEAMNPERVDAPELVELEREDRLSTDDRTFLRGVVRMPIWMRGTTPYTSEGGGLVFDDEGRPVVQRLEDVEIGLMLPVGVDSPPLVVWSDGTGATLRSPFSGSAVRELVDGGHAVLSWVPQFHDGRSGSSADPELSTFNFFNPEAGRTTFVQQAAEASLMLRVAREVLPGHALVGELQTERVVFGGHSQGALIGALAAGVEDGYAAWALHGVGGYLSNTIITRKDPMDFAALINGVLNIGGPLDRFHPVIQLAQLGSDPVDPGNFAALWRGTADRPSGTHVYVINGLLDDAVPYRSADHLIVAGDVPLLQPAGWDPDPFSVWNARTASGRTEGNERALDGSPLTIATAMDERHGHFTIYREAGVRRSFLAFMTSATEGMPEILPPQR